MAGSDSATLGELTAHCVRCGRPVPVDIALCEDCNPLGLSQPAATQVHGSVILVVGLAIVGLALLGRIVLAGIGPFTAEVSGVSAAAAGSGLEVTLTVHNEGSKTGSTTCRVFEAADEGISPASAYLLSPDIPAGQSVTFTKETAVLGAMVASLAVECSSP
ncbi:MAG TPA: hypothetical protein VIV06_06955 [Candidatus Limnocylindrales bacterium]